MTCVSPLCKGLVCQMKLLLPNYEVRNAVKLLTGLDWLLGLGFSEVCDFAICVAESATPKKKRSALMLLTILMVKKEQSD